MMVQIVCNHCIETDHTCFTTAKFYFIGTFNIEIELNLKKDEK